ncbi:MAG: ABC transporter ATP-binding protein [Roseburia sp.]|nr:ABC transporter ATP-binding protein [Roseburia sp.]
MIELKHVTKKYGTSENEVLALNDISLSIKEKELVAVVGTSGSGKSTLLNILGGMDQLSSGQYLFDGKDVAQYSDSSLHKFRKENVSFVFQNFALINRYTVYENVEIPLLARNIKHRKAIIMDCLDKLGIANLADKYPQNISGGQQQRCAIGRALVTDCRLLLCDEPTGALDSHTSMEIMELLREMNHSGKTVVVVTHDKDIAAECDRQIQLEDGKIVE